MGLERSEEDFLCGYGACCNPGDIMQGAVIGAGTIKGTIHFTALYGTANGTGWCMELKIPHARSMRMKKKRNFMALNHCDEDRKAICILMNNFAKRSDEDKIS